MCSFNKLLKNDVEPHISTNCGRRTLKTQKQTQSVTLVSNFLPYCNDSALFPSCPKAFAQPVIIKLYACRYYKDM